jgi:hypothetical protein
MKSEARIAPLKVLSYRKGVIMLDITKDIQPLTTFRRKAW